MGQNAREAGDFFRFRRIQFIVCILLRLSEGTRGTACCAQPVRRRGSTRAGIKESTPHLFRDTGNRNTVGKLAAVAFIS